MPFRAFRAIRGRSFLKLPLNTRTDTEKQDIRHHNAFPIKGKPNNKKYRYHFVQAAPFCKHYQIHVPRTLLFTNVDMDNDGTLILELNSAVAIGRGSR